MFLPIKYYWSCYLIDQWSAETRAFNVQLNPDGELWLRLVGSWCHSEVQNRWKMEDNRCLYGDLLSDLLTERESKRGDVTFFKVREEKKWQDGVNTSTCWVDESAATKTYFSDLQTDGFLTNNSSNASLGKKTLQLSLKMYILNIMVMQTLSC